MINLPENYNIGDYDRPSVATDIAVFTIRKNPSESYRHLSEMKFSVLMIKRKDEPYKDFLSLPGGFTVRTETIEQTAKRKLYEKTGVKDVPISLLYNSSAMGRDPRGWIISCAYWTLVESSQTALTEENASWYDVKFTYGEESILELFSDEGKYYRVVFHVSGNTELYNEAVKIETIENNCIAFDHAEIIARAIIQLRNSLVYPYPAFRLLPESFTLTQLQQVYESILDTPLLMANFRRKISPYVQETGEIEAGAGHRPSKLFKPVFSKERK